MKETIKSIIERNKKMEQYINKIINADCLDILKQLPDKCVDLVLTDPPYGIGIDGQKESVCKNPKHNRKLHSQKKLGFLHT